MKYAGQRKTRPLVLAATALLHLLAGAALWSLRTATREAEPQPLVTVRLLAARPAAAPIPSPAPPAPRAVDIPQPALLPAPQIMIAAAAPPTAAAALDAAAPAPSPTPAPAPISTAPPPAAPPPPTYQAAALPADHRACSARSISRFYPAMLSQRGIEGEVVLRVQVDERGHASEVQIQQGSGWRLLDEAARLVAQACPFVPARRGAQTLASWVEYPVRFALSPQLQ